MNRFNQKKTFMVDYLIFRKTRTARSLVFNRFALPLVNYYREFFKGKKILWGESRHSLSRFKKGSLGNEMSLFLTKNGFELNPKMESHDAFHVITGYGTEMYEEAAMQFFLIGNRKKSKLARISALVGFVIFPEYWKLYLASYRRGKETLHFSTWNFKEMLFADLHKFRKDIKLPERKL